MVTPQWEGWKDLSSKTTVGPLVERALSLHCAADELLDDWMTCIARFVITGWQHGCSYGRTMLTH